MLSPEGKWVASEAMYYGKGVTNNKAEGKACLLALESLERLVEKHPSRAMDGVVLLEDSRLWVEFLGHVASPNKRSLRVLL